MTPREKLVSRYQSKNPERNFDSDDDLYGAVNEEFEQTDGQMEGYRANEQKLLDLFNSSDQRGVEVFQRWKDGENPIAVIIEIFGDDAIDFIQNPANKDKFDAAYAKWAEKQAKEKALAAKETENGTASLENLDKVRQAGGYTDEQTQAAFDLLLRIADELQGGVISESTWKIAFNAVNHDRDVAAARDAGNVAGRNANIQERLRKPSRQAGPMLGSQGGGAPVKPMPLGGGAGNEGSAWARGKKK